MYPTNPIEKLENFFSLLPGVGHRTSQRYIEFLLSRPSNELQEISSIIADIKNYLKTCPVCHFHHIKKQCPLCHDPHREKTKMIILKNSQEVEAIEKSGSWKGLYHIIGGEINPMKGIGPEQLNFKTFQKRIKQNKITEIIIAINYAPEGDITADYIKKILKPLKIKVTRLARGLPTGVDIEYLDDETLQASIQNRH